MTTIKAGMVFPTNEGGQIEVLETINCYKVKIKHLDEYEHISFAEAGDIRKGSIKNPFHPSVLGVGYLGVGRYKATINNKRTPAYKAWSSMLYRVHSDSSLSHKPTYKQCRVCREWYNFQNFAEWYYQQPNAEKSGFDLDKDLTEMGNKEYNPDKCSLIPHSINSLLIDSGAIRGEYPIGVSKVRSGKFQARVKQHGKLKHLGTFGTADEAHGAYLREKTKHVRNLATEHKNLLNERVYENLMNWTLDAIEHKDV